MKKILFTFLLLAVLPAMASHIVGGEFELLHLNGNTYRLNMILYFDLLHGNSGAKDDAVSASIWRKSDGKLMDEVVLSELSEDSVGYTQPVCSKGQIQTLKIIYTNTVVLLPSKYSDPGGYYISWQRCCRNYTINNIYSQDPSTGGTAAGQTFYLEFPAVVKNGLPFINSSPHLFPPLNDFACPAKPYYVDFTGVDDDGDSLVYTMVTPLSTQTIDALPTPGPLPYPNVVWLPGFSLTNIMRGKPDLRISVDGLLTCTPTFNGLFVFAVKIEQFRNHEKIGESRRDFQMLVTDGCLPDSPPAITGKKSTDAAFSYVNTMSVSFSNATLDADRCIQVRVSDPDSQNPADHNTENIGIRVIPINFKSKDVNGILPAVTTATLVNGSTKDFSICFPQCPFVKSGTFQIGVIAFDDACSLPMLDTLKITVTVQPPANLPPQFNAPSPLPLTATLAEASQNTWPFEIVDPEGDSILLNSFGDNFNLPDAGMTVTVLTNKHGKITGTLHWDAFCDIYDYTKRTRFKVTLSALDLDACLDHNPTTAVFNLSVILPGVADVLVDTDLTPDPHEKKVLNLNREVGQSLDFNVTATQADNDLIVVSGVGKDFLLSDHKMQFATASAKGLATSPFVWDITCDDVNLNTKSVFDFYFVALDNTNKCRIPKRDTVEVKVTVMPTPNTKPELSIASLNNVPVVNNQMSIFLGQTISLNIIGTDVDIPATKMTLKMLDAEGTFVPKGYTFLPVSGQQHIQSELLWHPDCSIFETGAFTTPNDYKFKFTLNDEVCFNAKSDTITLAVKISDVDAEWSKFRPGNVITPNGDFCNDYLAFEGLDEDKDAIANCPRAADGVDNIIALPADNCTGHFQYIRIFNRWGKQVFQSSDRKFRWYAQHQDEGVYYYLLEYGNHQYKGSVSVRP